MPTSPKYPVYWDTWSTCQTCGFAVPSRYVIETRKHGFQCLPGSGRTRGCFDGMYDRDDIYFVYPDNEGTRETASPLADQGQPYIAFTVYVLRDSVTGILYAIDFGLDPPYVLTAIALADVDPDIHNGPFDWLEGTNGRRIYVANGSLTSGLFSTIYCPSAPGAVQAIPTFAAAPGDVVEEPAGCVATIPDMSNVFLAGDPFVPPQPPGVCYREVSGGTVVATSTSWANGLPGSAFDNTEIACKVFADFYCPQTLSPCTQVILDVDITCPGVGQTCSLKMVSTTAAPVLQADGTWGALPITGPFTGHITSIPLAIADPVTGVGLSCLMSFNISGPPFNPVVVSNPIVTVLP